MMGRVNSKERPGLLLPTFWLWNTTGPQLRARHSCARGQPGPGGCGAAGRETSAPAGRPGRAWWGKQRERRENLGRDCDDRPGRKGVSPTCATSSPSFEYRIGAGWAETQVSLLQPQVNASFPRPSRRPRGSLSQATERGTHVPGGAGRRDGQTPAPGPQRRS